MKPHFASLWFESPNNPKSFDDIRFVCDGKSVFRYDSTEKTITEQALRAKWPPPIADPRGGMLFAVNTKELAERFDIILLKTDTDRTYLDFMPRSKEDKRTFEVIRVALHGPGAAEEKCDYVPEQISMLKVNGDIDIGKFDNTQVNLPDVGEKDFAPVLLRGWRFTKAPWAVTPNIEP
jgi:TIGR03009 family protein